MSLELTELSELGISVTPDADAESDDLEGHRVIQNNDARIAKQLALAAVIEVSLPGYQVKGRNGSIGVAAEIAIARGL